MFGGTFDPVHVGHVEIALAVKRHFALESVLFIPAAHPPHKNGRAITPFQQRVEMLESALAPQPDLQISTIEALRSGPSYTIDTLIDLHRIYGPHCFFCFIIGADAFAEIGTWKDYAALPTYADFVILNRMDTDLDRLFAIISRHYPSYHFDSAANCFFAGPDQGRIFFLASEPLPVSSTTIREMVRAGHSIHHLVPSGVAHYISKQSLYR